MQAAKQRDTAAEISLRGALATSGLEYSVNRSPISGIRRQADLVFEDARLAVFVDGCFWHGCPNHGTWPKQNAEWWRKKIETNKLRDADTDRQLLDADWAVIRVWEHEDTAAVAKKIVEVFRARERPIRSLDNISSK